MRLAIASTRVTANVHGSTFSNNDGWDLLMLVFAPCTSNTMVTASCRVLHSAGVRPMH